MAACLIRASRVLLSIGLIVSTAWIAEEARAQAVVDEARQAGRAGQTFPAADEDYFQGMDGGVALTPDEVKGRNMWVVWTGGNDRLWDKVTNLTYGAFDLLKILSSYPEFKLYSRDNRWNYFGLVNEPCFTKATAPDPQRYGLWLDVRDPNCPADPFANEQKYPGVAVGVRGKNMPLGPYYGYPTGILGRRHVLATPADRHTRILLLVRERIGRTIGIAHVKPEPVPLRIGGGGLGEARLVDQTEIVPPVIAAI